MYISQQCLHVLFVFKPCVVWTVCFIEDSFSSWHHRRTNTLCDLVALPEFPELYTGNLNCQCFWISRFHCSVKQTTKSLFFTLGALILKLDSENLKKDLVLLSDDKRLPPGGVMLLQYNMRSSIFSTNLNSTADIICNYGINLKVNKTLCQIIFTMKWNCTLHPHWLSN